MVACVLVIEAVELSIENLIQS